MGSQQMLRDLRGLVTTTENNDRDKDKDKDKDKDNDKDNDNDEKVGDLGVEVGIRVLSYSPNRNPTPELYVKG